MKVRSTIFAMLLLGSVVAAGALPGFTSNGKTTMKTPAAAAGATVTISNFQFGPKVVRIKAGGEVTWEVKEGAHTVTADNGSFESPTLSAGKKYSHTFPTPGTFKYYCSFHGAKGGHDMAGTVIVTR
jgi:plastocyanin